MIRASLMALTMIVSFQASAIDQSVVLKKVTERPVVAGALSEIRSMIPNAKCSGLRLKSTPYNGGGVTFVGTAYCGAAIATVEGYLISEQADAVIESVQIVTAD